VTSHNLILLASDDIKRHISVGLSPLNMYLRVPGTKQTTRLGTRVTNYPDTAALVMDWTARRLVKSRSSQLADRSTHGYRCQQK